MRAHYKTANGRITFEVQGETTKAIFEEIAAVQEIFETEQACRICHTQNIRFQVRKVEDFTYYELVCQEMGCRARFQFGQAKKGGGLFPKRKAEDGSYLPNNGWSKYKAEGGNTHTETNAASGRSEDNTRVPF